MNHKISRRALLGAATLAPFAAQAQSDWPNRPVRIVVPFPLARRLIFSHD